MRLNFDPDGSTQSVLGTTLLIGLSGIAIGWLASEGEPIYLAALVVAIPALVIAAKPVWLLWIAVIGGLVFSGLFKLYLPQLQAFRWILAPVSVLLVLHSVVALQTAPFQAARRADVPTIIWWALAFLLYSVLIAIIQPFLADRLFIGFKGYFQVWGLLFALALFPWPVNVLDRLPKVLVAVGLLQLPVVLHQLIFLVPKRVALAQPGVVPIDVVAGTFGATVETGGANAALNAFLVIILAGLVAARDLGVISWARLCIFSLVLLIPILSNMAKVSVLYMIAAFLVLYGRDLIQRPLRFLAASLAATVLVVLLVAAYAMNSAGESSGKSLQEWIMFSYQYAVEDDVVSGTGYLSRGGVLRFWAERHGLGNLKETLFGHGMGFTRVADNADPFRETVRFANQGVVSDINIAMGIGGTAAAALLWELGVIGLLLAVGLLASTYFVAGRLERDFEGMPERIAALRASRAGMAIIFITLWHKHSFVFDIHYQTMLMLLLGYVAYWERRALISHRGNAVPRGNATHPAPSG